MIGRRIYYEKITGEPILHLGETSNQSATNTSREYDIQTFKVLSERVVDTFDVLELEYGQYTQDFAECNGYRVNPETKELEFSYPDPNDTEEPQPYQKPLSVELEELKQRQEATDGMVLQLLMEGMM